MKIGGIETNGAFESLLKGRTLSEEEIEEIREQTLAAIEFSYLEGFTVPELISDMYAVSVELKNYALDASPEGFTANVIKIRERMRELKAILDELDKREEKEE